MELNRKGFFIKVGNGFRMVCVGNTGWCSKGRTSGERESAKKKLQVRERVEVARERRETCKGWIFEVKGLIGGISERVSAG